MTSLQRAAGLAASSSSVGCSTTSVGASVGVRRARPGSTTHNSHPNKNEPSGDSKRRGGGGIFEASFGGLDLSEFGAGGTAAAAPTNQNGTATPPKSAAAQLLQKKKQEAERTQRDAEEEAIMQANAVALAQEQTRRLAAMKEKHDLEGRDNGRSKQMVHNSMDGRPADGMEFLGQGMFSTLVHMHGNDNHGAKRESSGNNAKSAATMRLGNATKTSKLADAVASKKGGPSAASKRVSRLAKISTKKSPSSGTNEGVSIGKRNQRPKGVIKKGKRAKF